MFIKSIIRRITPAVKWRPGRRFLVILALATMLVLGGMALVYEQVDRRSQADEARRADAIIILGCSVWPGGRPSPALAARIRHAIALYQAGYANHLVLTGGVGAFPPAESEVMRRVALAAGVPPEALVAEDRSHSTEENLANAKALMDEQGWHRALIVSDPFHLYRAEKMARDLGIDAYGSPASDSPTYTNRNLRVWYTGRETIALVWYYATRVVGEPAWLYGLLKGRI